MTHYKDVPTEQSVTYDQQQQEQSADNKERNDSIDCHQTDELDEQQQQQTTLFQKLCQWWIPFYWKNEFVLLVILAIGVAKLYPPLGAIYFLPKITATWMAVMFIFLLAGIELKTSEFTYAFQQFQFNVCVQLFNFGVVSLIVYGVSRGLQTADILESGIADGMIICGCLPMTINMCVVLSKAANGDEAAAIFNAAFGNMMGVFLSPLLILGYLSVNTNQPIDLMTVFFKLGVRVVLPVVVGQVLQAYCSLVVDCVKHYKQYFKHIQQYTLVFIVYTVFCTTFLNPTGTGTLAGVFTMVACIVLLMMLLMILAWTFLRCCFPHQPRLCVMGLFGCTHKTAAMGIPLINALYESDPQVGLYTLPILIWYPTQLILGSYLTPYLAQFVLDEELKTKKEEEAHEHVESGFLLTPTNTIKIV